MAPPAKRSRARRIFRAIRITILALVLLVVGAAIYLNEIGLPGFLKRPLLARLREHGIELQFTRLRFHWNRGVVAENVRFGTTGVQSNAPNFSANEVELRLDHGALAHFHFLVDS